MLMCVECGRVQADNERGWRSYLTTDEEEPTDAIVYCPSCAEREFGPLRRVGDKNRARDKSGPTGVIVVPP